MTGVQTCALPIYRFRCAASRGAPEAVRRKLVQICGRQYLRTLVCYEVQSHEQGGTRVRSWSDLAEYRRLLEHYFGLRVLITDRSEWTTAQIVEAYRGQSRVESTSCGNLASPTVEDESSILPRVEVR